MVQFHHFTVENNFYWNATNLNITALQHYWQIISTFSLTARLPKLERPKVIENPKENSKLRTNRLSQKSGEANIPFYLFFEIIKIFYYLIIGLL